MCVSCVCVCGEFFQFRSIQQEYGYGGEKYKTFSGRSGILMYIQDMAERACGNNTRSENTQEDGGLNYPAMTERVTG